jgi:hypothetical protein
MSGVDGLQVVMMGLAREPKTPGKQKDPSTSHSRPEEPGPSTPAKFDFVSRANCDVETLPLPKRTSKLRLYFVFCDVHSQQIGAYSVANQVLAELQAIDDEIGKFAWIKRGRDDRSVRGSTVSRKAQMR